MNGEIGRRNGKRFPPSGVTNHSDLVGGRLGDVGAVATAPMIEIVGLSQMAECCLHNRNDPAIEA